MAGIFLTVDFRLFFSMTRLIANCDLYNPGDYGRVRAGEEFTCRDSTAEKLCRSGSARRVLYEMKVIAPAAPEVSARDPFCFLPVFDAQPGRLAAESDPVLPDAELPEPRTADSGKRGGRKASRSSK
jgi:hypothetical protein